jgi:hypothetical protein
MYTYKLKQNTCNEKGEVPLRVFILEHVLTGIKYEGKVATVPQHTYGGAGGRGGIAPTHSRPRH